MTTSKITACYDFEKLLDVECLSRKEFLESYSYLGNKDFEFFRHQSKSIKYEVYRYQEGIILNPREYLLDKNGEVKIFNKIKDILKLFKCKSIETLESMGVHLAVFENTAVQNVVN